MSAARRLAFNFSKKCYRCTFTYNRPSFPSLLRAYSSLHHSSYYYRYEHLISRSSSSSSQSFTQEYVHPLSQIVLEHLQNQHSEWVQLMGLNKGLELRKDGTFILRFPSTTTASATKEDGNDNDDDALKGSSIWTMYEAEEKKHYLCIRNGKLVGQYLLQDNKKPAWHTDKRSTPERVQDAVDEMIQKLGGH